MGNTDAADHVRGCEKEVVEILVLEAEPGLQDAAVESQVFIDRFFVFDQHRRLRQNDHHFMCGTLLKTAAQFA